MVISRVSRQKSGNRIRVSGWYNNDKVFSFSHHRWDPFFTIFAFLGIILGRLINIYPITEIVNFSRPAEAKIPERFDFFSPDQPFFVWSYLDIVQLTDRWSLI